MADFDSLIELITSTVAPTSWDEVGGPGSIAPFQGGVWVDAQGLMRRVLRDDLTGRLSAIRQANSASDSSDAVRRRSILRKVSLPRLERAVQLRLAAGQDPSEEMQMLAGLERVQYVLVYPETGDLVLAGPAGEWRHNEEGRVVSVDSGAPVLRLDDLVVVLRHMTAGQETTFGCSITPVQESLARTRAFLQESSKRSISRAGRGRWLKQVRDQMGQQDIEYFGIDPRTRVAHVLVEADYRMKLVGIGLEKGTLGVPSYLSLIDVPPGQAPPALGVLRWWFALNYEALLASPEHDAYELRGQGVKVLSENELLTARGQRVHTGESEPLNLEFTRNFTKHFKAMAEKYPVYAELRNIFDLALACALIEAEGLGEQVDWHQTCFSDPEQFAVDLSYAPQSVESVINDRTISRTQFVAAVSGGVRVDTRELVKAESIAIDKNETLSSHRSRAVPGELPRDRWWWD